MFKVENLDLSNAKKTASVEAISTTFGWRLAFCLCLVASCLLMGCDSVERDWDGARKENSIAAYEGFLKRHTGSSHEKDARDKIAELKWQSTLQQNTVDAFINFFSVYGIDKDKVTKANSVLGPNRFAELSTAQQRLFKRALVSAVDPTKVEELIVRYQGFEFANEGVALAEKLWGQKIVSEGASNRFRIPNMEPNPTEPLSQFTVVASEGDRATAKFTSKGNAISGAMDLETNPGKGSILTVTEMPEDSFVLLMGQSPFFGQGKCWVKPIKSKQYGVGTIVRFAAQHSAPVEGTTEISSDGDRMNRLTFVMSQDQGLIYVRGVGRVKMQTDGPTIALSPKMPQGSK